VIFALLNTREFPCPRTHKLHFKKFASGFVQNGANFIEITDVRSISALSEDDILYVSNHFSCDITHRYFKSFLQQKLIKTLKTSQCKMLFWNFHTTAEPLEWKCFTDRALHLGEDMLPEYLKTEDVLVNFRKQYPVHELKYSSAYEAKPSYKVKREYDFQFVGSHYKSKWLKHCQDKYNCFIKIAPPSIDEVVRINSFKKSVINLVFHSDANIKKGIIVERFAEAISLGGIIVHDHPRIAELFPNIPSLFYVRSTKEIDDVFKFIHTLTPFQIEELKRGSRECWENSDLSYRKQAKLIIEKLGEIHD